VKALAALRGDQVMRTTATILCTFLGLFPAFAAHAMDAAVRAKVDEKLQQITAWAADPAVVAAVKAQNSARSPDAAAMTQQKWASVSVLDPFVRGLFKNPAAQALKSKQTAEVSEAFLSSADGCKVAFLTKPTSWCHKGKPKHDVPMTGKVWQGPVEVDASTGTQQIQISVPVMDGGKAIGSLTVGFSVAKL
jgi:hypothetical protein